MSLLTRVNRAFVTTPIIRGHLRHYGAAATRRHERKPAEVEKIEITGPGLDKIVEFTKVGHGPNTFLVMPGFLGPEYDFPNKHEMIDEDSTTAIFWNFPDQSATPKGYVKQGMQIFKEQARYGLELMAKLGYEKFTGMGQFTGGISALIMAALFPEEVERLIVWGVRPLTTETDVDSLKANRDIDRWNDEMKKFMPGIFKCPSGRKDWQDLSNFFMDLHAKNKDKKGNGDVLGSFLKQIKCPTLILHGERDSWVKTRHLFELYKGIFLDRVEVIDGGHNVHIDNPTEFVNFIRIFLEQDLETWTEFEAT